MGNDVAVGIAGSQGILELNTFQPMLAANVLRSIHLLANAARLFATRCVDGIEADEARALRYARSSPSISTALVPSLGYDRVAELVKTSAASGIDMVEAASALMPRAEAEAALDVHKMARGEN
jgi:fumarate hydratase class II